MQLLLLSTLFAIKLSPAVTFDVQLCESAHFSAATADGHGGFLVFFYRFYSRLIVDEDSYLRVMDGYPKSIAGSTSKNWIDTRQVAEGISFAYLDVDNSVVLGFKHDTAIHRFNFSSDGDISMISSAKDSYPLPSSTSAAVSVKALGDLTVLIYWYKDIDLGWSFRTRYTSLGRAEVQGTPLSEDDVPVAAAVRDHGNWYEGFVIMRDDSAFSISVRKAIGGANDYTIYKHKSWDASFMKGCNSSEVAFQLLNVNANRGFVEASLMDDSDWLTQTSSANRKYTVDETLAMVLLTTIIGSQVYGLSLIIYYASD